MNYQGWPRNEIGKLILRLSLKTKYGDRLYRNEGRMKMAKINDIMKNVFPGKFGN